MTCTIAFTSPLCFIYSIDKEMVACFSLDQQIDPKPKLKTYLEVDLQYVPFPSKSKYVHPMTYKEKPTP